MHVKTMLVLALVLSACGSAQAPSSRTAWNASEPALATLLFRDSFDPPSSLGDGLSSALGARQAGVLAPAPWSLRSGVWYDAPPAAASMVGIDHALVFHGFASTRLEAPIVLREDARYRIAMHADPAVGDVESLSWIAIALTPSRESGGWPTAPEMLLGFFVRSNGAAAVFSHAHECASAWTNGAPPPVDVRDVELVLEPIREADPPGWRVHGRVDGSTFESVIVGVDPSEPVYLHLTAHFHESTAMLSRVSDVSISELP